MRTTTRLAIALTTVLCATTLRAAPLLSDFELRGRIDGENITFDLTLAYSGLARGQTIDLVSGPVALIDSKLPRRALLRRDGEVVRLVRGKGWGGADGRVRLAFAARTTASGDWRHASFELPVLPVRLVSVAADRPGLEIRFPTGRGLVRAMGPDGRDTATINLGTASCFEVRWKPEIKRVESELVATCDINSIVTASPGTLRFDSLYNYRIAQGQLGELSFALPEVNILQVSGGDIQDWRIDRADPAAPRLRVTLGRPQQGEYALQVEYERPLPAFPCKLELPVLAPQGVIRAGGQLLLGTDSAVKLQIAESSGVTQIDQAAFARQASLRGDRQRAVPARSVFTYQYAALPYALTLSADHVATSLSGEIDLLVNVAEGQIALEAQIRLEVRDAPAREVKLVTDADARWMLIGVTGRQVVETDVDVRTVGGKREILVPFRQPVEGQTVLNLRLEMPMGLARDSFAVPAVSLPEARTQRGCLVAAAEHGIRLVPRKTLELRDVHTASTPFRAEGAQLAYRFREPGWQLELGLEWAQSAIHSELFHLLSLGEGVVYVSAAVNCHISGAPVQTLSFRIPDAGESLEIVGAGIDNWSRSNDICRVQLATRTMGDTTLLIAYDQPLGYDGAELPMGGIETIDTASEMGFIAVATSAGLRIEEAAALPSTLIRIPRDELPAGYAATVTAPVLAVYKYTRRPHAAKLRVTALETQRPIDQVVDYLALTSRIGRDGESVTHAIYHVKNASRQFIEARLPADANLWRVRQGLDAEARDLPAQQDGERILIPVVRPRDPNQAVPIEIVYAQPAPPRRLRLPRVRLTAPLLGGAPTTFARWEVSADDNRAIGRTGGNMTPEDGRAARLPWAAPGRRGQRSASFYRTANLAGEEGLTVTVELLPNWLAGGSPRLLVAAAAAGIVALLVGLARRRKLWFALSLTLLALAAAQTRPGAIAVAIAAVTGLLASLIAAAVRGIARCVRCRRTSRRSPDDSSPPSAPPLAPETPVEAAPREEAGSSTSSESGAAAPALLLLLGAFALAVAQAWPLRAEPAQTQQAPAAVAAATPAPAALAVERLEVEARAPALTPEAEPVAEVRWTLRFRTDTAGKYLLFPPGGIVSEARIDAARLRLVPGAAGTVIEVLKAGEHTLTLVTREGVSERNGEWRLALPWFVNLYNSLVLTIPAPDMEATIAQAASLKRMSAEGVTRVEAALADCGCVEISWKPRARDTRKEAAVVYADAATLARLRPGVVEMQTRAAFNVVQGEAREFELTAPAGMTVTAVSAPNLATWRFDPLTRLVKATLARPVSGSLTVTLTLQAPCGGLPYDWSLGVPAAGGVQRQRGRIALAAPDEIMARIGETKGVTAIDTADFSLAGFETPPARPTPDDGVRQAAAPVPAAAHNLRRAFRYDDPAAVAIALHAEEVQPEIRVSEASSFSVGDERNMLSSALEVTVAKSGVFALRLDIPADYEIESLAGRDVSHWDDSQRAEQGVEVFLTRRVQDTTPINLVLSRQQRGIPAEIVVPRVQVRGAARHTGRIAVASERGVKLAVEQIEAAVARRAEEKAPSPAGVLNFDILRPGWRVALRAQVLAPLLKPEMLHRVELAEGMLQHRVHLRYRIENAGIKFFRVRVPAAEAPLTVTGRNIARVRPLDAAAASNGVGRVWEIELHGKVEDDFSLVCQYQESYDPAGGGVEIRPFEPLGVARQAGFLVVTGGGRVQVEPLGGTEGLKPEDARTLPDTFGAGDLSGALRCYRVLRPDYRLTLSVVRHAAAAVLPAQIEQVQLITVLSGSGRLLTQATITLQPGNLRFLRVVLPSPSSALWVALVNGSEAPVAREAIDGAETLSIALEGMAPEQRSSVTLVYAASLPGRSLSGRHALLAPRFVDLPLRDIQWRLFVPPEYRWRLRDGDLDMESGGTALRSFGQAAYASAVQQAQQASLKAARGNLQSLDGLLSEGRQKEARNVLQQAVNLSQGEQALNEDARVQFRNVVKQQVKMGLVNRRQVLRAEQNIYDERTAQTQAGWNDGNFDARYAQRVEEQLDAADRDNLDMVAGKIVEQQWQAAPAATAIQIAMPEHGREYRLRRALLNVRGGELRLAFEARRSAFWPRLLAFWPLLPSFLGVWLLLRLALGGHKDSQGQ